MLSFTCIGTRFACNPTLQVDKLTLAEATIFSSTTPPTTVTEPAQQPLLRQTTTSRESGRTPPSPTKEVPRLCRVSRGVLICPECKMPLNSLEMRCLSSQRNPFLCDIASHSYSDACGAAEWLMQQPLSKQVSLDDLGCDSWLRLAQVTERSTIRQTSKTHSRDSRQKPAQNAELYDGLPASWPTSLRLRAQMAEVSEADDATRGCTHGVNLD
eukprot:4098167-Amphidinium_carterae.1